MEKQKSVDYLHEQIAELRHNEMFLLVFAVFFSILALLFIATTGLILRIFSMIIAICCLVGAIYFSYKREKLIEKLKCRKGPSW